MLFNKKQNKQKVFIFFLMLFLLGVFLVFSISDFSPKNNDVKSGTEAKKENNLYDVISVIDGDTFVVQEKGRKEHIRVLGLNTPEARDFKHRTRECFGKEASKRAKELLAGRRVFLETDDSQSKVDKYGRLLRHVFLENGDIFAEIMIRDGYGFEYTYHGIPHKYQKRFLDAQKEAKDLKKGLWGEMCQYK